MPSGGARLAVVLGIVACGDPEAARPSGGTAAPPEAGAPLAVCSDVGPAVVFDVDETLTVADEELVLQLQDSAYEPLPRAGGAELAGDYAALGYLVVYLSARSEEMTLQSGETVRDATARWLLERGYPAGRTRLVLAPTNAMVAGDPAAAYKVEALTRMQAEGLSFEFAYGNADSDIAAYAAAGIRKEATFIIGERAGAEGTVAAPGEDWIAHRAAHVPTLEPVCAP